MVNILLNHVVHAGPSNKKTKVLAGRDSRMFPTAPRYGAVRKDMKNPTTRYVSRKVPWTLPLGSSGFPWVRPSVITLMFLRRVCVESAVPSIRGNLKFPKRRFCGRTAIIPAFHETNKRRGMEVLSTTQRTDTGSFNFLLQYLKKI